MNLQKHDKFVQRQIRLSLGTLRLPTRIPLWLQSIQLFARIHRYSLNCRIELKVLQLKCYFFQDFKENQIFEEIQIFFLQTAVLQMYQVFLHFAQPNTLKTMIAALFQLLEKELISQCISFPRIIGFDYISLHLFVQTIKLALHFILHELHIQQSVPLFYWSLLLQ